MTIETNHSFLPTGRNKLFDMQVVCEMLVAGIILYTSEKHLEIDEDEIAEFVIMNFPQIVSSITDDGENG